MLLETSFYFYTELPKPCILHKNILNNLLCEVGRIRNVSFSCMCILSPTRSETFVRNCVCIFSFYLPTAVTKYGLQVFKTFKLFESCLYGPVKYSVELSQEAWTSCASSQPCPSSQPSPTTSRTEFPKAVGYLIPAFRPSHI